MFHRLPRLAQEQPSACGPATLAMVLSFWGHRHSQSTIVDAAGNRSTIQQHGTNAFEMARAVSALTDSQFTLLIKKNSTLKEISDLTKSFPLIVNWQQTDPDHPDIPSIPETDIYGHYSVTLNIDIKRRSMVLADPEAPYAGQDRQLSTDTFEQRWFDYDLRLKPPQSYRHTFILILPSNQEFKVRGKVHHLYKYSTQKSGFVPCI